MEFSSLLIPRRSPSRRDVSRGGADEPLERNFIAIALPAVIAAVAVFCIRHSRAAQAQSANGAVVPGVVPAAAAK